MDKEFSKHSCKYTSLHIKDVCPKYAEIQLWGLIIGPFLIPAAEALVFLLRQLVFEKGKEASPPSLAATYGEEILGRCQRFWRKQQIYKKLCFYISDVS